MENVNPLLSVVIPVYNVKKYLARCIESVIKQKYSNLEIILVDDGSTDGSSEECDLYAKKDKRIRVIHKENGGIVSARKEGALAANGEYITCVDSDDWIEDTMYEELMKIVCGTQSQVVTSGIIRDYGNHCIREDEHIQRGTYEGERLVKELLCNMISTSSFFEDNISIHIYNKIYERKLYLKYQLLVDNKIRVGDDAGCIYPCLLNSERITVSGKSFYHYCIRNDSTMGNKRKDEDGRLQILFTNLKKEFECHALRIPNIMVQFMLLKDYVLLLQQAEKVVAFRDEILFPFGSVRRDDKVLLYGAGRFGKELKRVIEEQGCCTVVDQIDKAGKAFNPEYLKNIDYDKILIAVLKGNIVKEIQGELVAQGVSTNKILSIDCNLLRIFGETINENFSHVPPTVSLYRG